MALYRIRADVVDARQITDDTEYVLTTDGRIKPTIGQWYVTRLVQGVLEAKLMEDAEFRMAFEPIGPKEL